MWARHQKKFYLPSFQYATARMEVKFLSKSNRTMDKNRKKKFIIIIILFLTRIPAHFSNNFM